MRGKVYGVGVGPGDPELMTLKAVRLIREAPVIAVPGKRAEESTAWQIAVRSVPELSGKTLLAIDMPMTRDRAVLEEAHAYGARRIAEYLDRGMDVVYLTLGDPTVYCSFGYLQKMLEEEEYEAELVSGVPSFCAAAARAGISLAEGEEAIHIFPGTSEEIEAAGPADTVIVMKSGRKLRTLSEKLEEDRRRVFVVSGCGMPGESIYRSAGEVPENAGYFSIMVAKGKEER